jgi:hypothetical protein
MTMESKTESIRRKIERLRRLGEHPASDPNEAAAALALAQRLMDEHGIAEAVLGTEDAESDEQTRETFEKQSEPWKGIILYALTQANGCASLRSPHEKWMRVFGRRGDVETVAYLFRYCIAEVERLAHRNTRGMGRAYASAYRKGAASAIARAIRAESERTTAAARAQYANDSRALVAVDQWANRKASAEIELRRMHPRVGKARSSTIGSRDGYGAGQRDGAGVYGGRGAPGLGGGSLRIGSGS